MKQLRKSDSNSFASAVFLLPLILFITVSYATVNDSPIGNVSEIIRQVSTYGAYEAYQKLVGRDTENLSGSNIIKLNEEISPFNGSIMKTSDWMLLEYKEQSNTFSIQANGQFGYKLSLPDREQHHTFVRGLLSRVGRISGELVTYF